jgi:hypothetical protein
VVEGIVVPAYRRSAFQVALLLFASFGLYVFAWSYFIRRACAAILEQDDQPVWKTVALIIPIFNLFLMFELGKKIQGVQWRADPSRTDDWLPWLGTSFFFFGVLGRLKGPEAMLGLLAFTPVAAMQRRFSRAQAALLGDAAVPTRLRWIEWVIVVLGCGFWAAASLAAVILMFTADPDRALPVWVVGTVAVSVVALILFASASRRAIAQGLAMHANPSPDQITKYTA